MKGLADLVAKVREYHPQADTELIDKAFAYSERMHEGQMRKSGDPYFIHPSSVAHIIAEMKLDPASICAALLHDVVEDTDVTEKDIEQQFGKEVAFLVDGVTKLGKVNFHSKEDRQAETFRKMLVAMARDIRVLLVKLADRLDNMRTLEHMKPESQERIARETMEIYAPLAGRLGINWLKAELEDLSFRYLHPDAHAELSRKVKKASRDSERYITDVTKRLQKMLIERGFAVEVQGRVKHLYSIFRKMRRQNIEFEQVQDFVAFRVLMENVADCYAALGVVHSQWTPVPGRFKDYIALPKPNMYQSLHTTVIGPGRRRIEVQIRTHEMHRTAEYGIAAHWKYKEGRPIADKDEMKFKWIRRLLQWQKELSDPTEFLDTVKLDLFADDVYVFTPNGELRELPRGATPIDFAYNIHTDVGHSCVGSKVNGKIVPLRYQLHSGDTVEILTGKEKRPHKDWLQFVKTSRAKAKIRNFLRSEEHEQSAAIGRELLEKALSKYRVNLNKAIKSKEMLEFAKKASYDSVESVLAAVGYGKISPMQVVAVFVPHEELHPEERPKQKEPMSVVGKLVKKLTKSRGLVKVSGMSDMLVHFGKCCSPLPGDTIVGYVTRGRGVSIHVNDCPKVVGMDPARRIDVEWDSPEGALSEATIRIVCVDKPGLLASITDAITNESVNIAAASVRTTEDHTAINTFELQLKDVNQLRAVIKSLERLKGIISVERVKAG